MRRKRRVREEREEERDENREEEDKKERGDEREKEKGEDKQTEKEGSKEENKEKEMVSLKEKTYSRRVSKDRSLEVVKRSSKNLQNSEMERDRSSEEGNLEVLPVEKEKEDMRDVLVVEKEKEDGNEKGKEMEDMREVFLVEKETGSGNNKEKEMEQMREKRERRRVSKLITKKKGNLEIVAVEDSDFHDFDKDRRERSFKKGQVWAVYDDDDGMPRHYALIDEIVSVNPFEVTLSWLQFQNNGDDELISWQRKGLHVSCGSFKVSKKVSIKYLNLFSHVVDCERAARQMYRIYPTKGTVWALYSNTEGTNQGDKKNRCYDIVVALSSYSDVHGVSIAHLEKVSGFKTVFKRREVGANAVVCLAKDDVKLFSHQIPAKKLSGEEASGLPKDGWELDPASLAPQLLIGP
ncbi:UNVERIFIED_CONTAM: hypothetical protein Scaly_0874300 [Sesamum calycinum]|uniref:DUF3444 domain-containing protein n=1 Tax=Sesamum calycinum TaxID=2727403 RepID=A0AAW2QW33_9LAMI